MSETAQDTPARRVVHVELRHLLLGIGALVLTLAVLAVAGLIGYLIGVGQSDHHWRGCPQVAIPEMWVCPPVIQPGGPIEHPMPLPAPAPPCSSKLPLCAHSSSGGGMATPGVAKPGTTASGG